MNRNVYGVLGVVSMLAACVGGSYGNTVTEQGQAIPQLDGGHGAGSGGSSGAHFDTGGEAISGSGGGGASDGGHAEGGVDADECVSLVKSSSVATSAGLSYIGRCAYPEYAIDCYVGAPCGIPPCFCRSLFGETLICVRRPCF
jgi:hypothetical protein